MITLTKEELSIDNIIQLWANKRKRDLEIDQLDIETTHSYRYAAFCVLAWITLLVPVHPHSKADCFKATFPEGCTQFLSEQRLNSSSRPTSALIRGFCQTDLLPGLEPAIVEGSPRHPEFDLIYVSSINYGMLHEFGKVTIEWTSTLSCHLIFNESTRTLYLFSLPTFCALGYLEGGSGGVFDR